MGNEPADKPTADQSSLEPAGPIFSFTDSVADAARVGALSFDRVDAATREAERREYQAAALRVLLAGRIGHEAFMRIVDARKHQPGGVHAPDKAAVGEVSLRLRVSRSKASRWLSLASFLEDQPVISRAFMNGEFSINRAWMIASTLCLLDEDTRGQAEPLALTLAARPTTDPTLRHQLEELVIALDPDAAVEAREDFRDRNQDVRISDEPNGHASIDACVPAEHGLYLRDRIAGMIAERICFHDPRTLGVQRVTALAEIHGQPGVTLVCACGLADCARLTGPPAEPDPEPEPEPEPESEPAAVPESTGHELFDWIRRHRAGLGPFGSTARDTARGPSGRNGTREPWDPPAPSHTDSRDDEGPEPAAASSHPGAEADADADADARSGAAESSSQPAQSSPEMTDGEMGPASSCTDTNNQAPKAFQTCWTLITDPTGEEMPYLQGYGAIDPNHADALREESMTATLEVSDLMVSLTGHGPGPAPPVDPTGHGGHTKPPRGALKYRPSARMRERILAMDRTCRYPFCGRPSHKSQIDHIVKFNHDDPEAGGWTTEYNLAPLCTADHHRKHMGFWIPTMHTNRSITWRNPETAETITTHPR